jgi:hypothetical protein
MAQSPTRAPKGCLTKLERSVSAPALPLCLAPTDSHSGEPAGWRVLFEMIDAHFAAEGGKAPRAPAPSGAAINSRTPAAQQASLRSCPKNGVPLRRRRRQAPKGRRALWRGHQLARPQRHTKLLSTRVTTKKTWICTARAHCGTPFRLTSVKRFCVMFARPRGKCRKRPVPRCRLSSQWRTEERTREARNVEARFDRPRRGPRRTCLR